MSRWIWGVLLLAAVAMVCTGAEAQAHWPSHGASYYCGPGPAPYPYGVYYWRPPVVVAPGPVFVAPRIGFGYVINPYGQGYRPVYVQRYRAWYGPYAW